MKQNVKDAIKMAKTDRRIGLQAIVERVALNSPNAAAAVLLSEAKSIWEHIDRISAHNPLDLMHPDDPLESVEMAFRNMLFKVNSANVAWMQAIVIGLDEETLQADANRYKWPMAEVLRLKRLRQNWMAIQSRLRIG